MRRKKHFITDTTSVYRPATIFSTTKLQLNLKKPSFSKQTVNFYKQTSNITFPIAQEHYQRFSPTKNLSKKNISLNRLSLSRSNLKYLNNYLKKKSSLSRNKDRRVSNMNNECFGSSPIDIMRQKVQSLIRLQKIQSQLLLQQSPPIFFLHDLHLANLQIQSNSIEKKFQRAKQHTSKLCFQNNKISSSFIIRKQRLISPTPSVPSSELSKKDGSKVHQQKFIQIRDSQLTGMSISTLSDKNNNQLNKMNFQVNKINLSFKKFPL